MSGFVAAVRARLPGRRLVIAAPYLWLTIFFLVPFLLVFKISLADSDTTIPPYTALFTMDDDSALQITLHLDNFLRLVSDDPIYLLAYLSSLRNAAVTTLFCLLLGYPMAYAIARTRPTVRPVLLMMIILPFWTSFLIRIYAWIGILKDNGLLNNFLIWLGVIDTPVTILNTQTAVYIGMIYAYLPFMVLPLYATLEKLDVSLLEAAMDLGARPLRAFWAVTLPLSMPGIIAGSLLVFIPAVGEFIIPSLLGGADTLTISTQLWSEFFSNRDWPMASAVTVVMVALLVVPLMLLQRAQGRAAAQP
ncbi:MAG TPA: ABC transporter permease subunit [Aliidongia sp.]|uniref:ABC transporter permease subunit n=1 Tax=Aliidongia sp. TaxID=1914230 RepID=UPI002DDDA755|nr:ABC transporter permease subunit [Aliidongia sp.]HEV2674030.1 ABC transporter permease subunit [Aliidongia sp.]